MPVMNGCESTVMIRKYLKENAPNLKQPFIVCTSSYSGETFKKQASKAGMDLFQNKPIFKTTLVKLLAKIDFA